MEFDAKDWPMISTLFDEALDLPAERLDRWLAELSGERQVFRGVLQRLLADHRRMKTKDFLGKLPSLAVAHDPEESDIGQEGALVGPYRLLREIGRGGMGSVWLAERTDGLLKRTVALKLPHPGLATRAFADRLARERDILASLTHRHIARLYDAGVTSQGQPYIALAYVQGLTLLEHCARAGLGTRDRVELFRQVLDAVRYAHAHLVIHRDLKPSNVLVDEDGQVHLLDFGIAKLLVDGQAESTELTLDVGQALTLDYASPEQIAGAGVSTASDVYSLGVLLFELLAGVRPYHLQRDSPAALAQTLRDIDLPSPSTAARGTGNVAAARALRGDLDTIIRKCLRFDAAMRYATADAFDQDLRRHLEGATVLARPDTAAYRFGKFVRRYRIAVAAAGMVVIALGAGLAGTAWQANRAREQAQRAQAVQDFLISLFDKADPVRSGGRELTALQMLDSGQHDLHSRLADQPRLREQLDGVLATLYDKLDDDAKALPLAEDRRDLALRLDGPTSLEYGDSLFQLADIQGSLNSELGYEIYEQARHVLARYEGQRRGELLRIDGSQAFLLGTMGRFEESARLLRGTLPKMETHFGARSWEVVHHKGLLLYADTQTGSFRDARDLVRSIEPLLDGIGADHVLDVAVVRGNMAMAELRMGRPEHAGALAQRASDDFERMLGPDARQTLSLRRMVVDTVAAVGQFGRAADAYEELARRSERAFGEADHVTRICKSMSVESLVMVGRVAEAETFARSSMRAASGVKGAPRARDVEFENRLGLALTFSGKATEAVTLLSTSLDEAKRSGADRGGDHGRTLLYLAGARLAQGRPEDAAQAASSAEQVFAADQQPALIWVAKAQLTQALALARVGQLARARELVSRARATLHDTANADHPIHLMAQLVGAQLLRAAGDALQADRVEQDARARLGSSAGVVLPREIPLVF